MRARSAVWAAAVAWVLSAEPASAADGAAGAQPRRLLVATRDAALHAALSAVFAPRGVEVVESFQPLRRPADAGATAPAAGAAAADTVWLCEPDSGGTALCVRPRHGQVIVRRIAMPTPLSAEDAASLALSVQVALMPEEPAATAAPAPARATAPVDVEAAAPRPAPPAPPAPRLTVELLAGGRRTDGGGGLRAGVEAVYAPDALARRLGIGLGVAGGTAIALPQPSARGPAPVPPGGSEHDLTLRLFARGRLSLPVVRLELDLGPAAHVVTRDVSDGTNGGGSTSERRVHVSANGSLGLVVPFGRFFAGARVGGFYLLAPEPPSGASPWRGEVLATVGAVWF